MSTHWVGPGSVLACPGWACGRWAGWVGRACPPLSLGWPPPDSCLLGGERYYLASVAGDLPGCCTSAAGKVAGSLEPRKPQNIKHMLKYFSCTFCMYLLDNCWIFTDFINKVTYSTINDQVRILITKKLQFL